MQRRSERTICKQKRRKAACGPAPVPRAVLLFGPLSGPKIRAKKQFFTPIHNFTVRLRRIFAVDQAIIRLRSGHRRRAAGERHGSPVAGVSYK